MAAPPLLCQLGTVKQALGIPSGYTAQDNQIQFNLDAADAAIKKWCKRELVQAVYGPAYPLGSVQQNIVLRQRPLRVYFATGNLSSTSPIITNIAFNVSTFTTANLIPGMPVVIGASWEPSATPPTNCFLTGTTIASINSSTQITVQNTQAIYNGQNPVLITLANAPLVIGIAAWIDPMGLYGGGLGANSQTPPGPYGPQTELRYGLDYAAKLDGENGQGASGMLVRVRGWGGAGMSSGWWGDGGGYGSTGGYGRNTLTAGRVPGWPSGQWGETQVIYTAGYNPIPADLAQACLEYTIFLRRNAGFGGQQASSESYRGYSYGVLANDPSKTVADLRSKLMQYREVITG